MLEVCKEFTDSGEHRYTNLAICPLAGEAEPELFGISANSVALRFGEACGPDTTFRALMTTPFTGLQADAKTWKDGQRRSRALNEIAKLAERATFAFTGIGGTDENCALWRLARHCDMPILSGVKSKVAGDICYRPITADGNDGWTDLSDRLFGLELDGLRALARSQARRVFAIASGRQKAIGIIAAVRGGYVNSLITDEITAADILANLPEPDGPGQVPASRECTHECGSQPPCTNPEEG
jgi:DNA-binding transcriptional regulator LsrR (DeoR family)